VTRPAWLRVDFIACDGRGLCAEVLPQLITLDDWGFPIVSDRDVPPRLLARRARNRPVVSPARAPARRGGRRP